MLAAPHASKQKGKIPELCFQCSIQLFNSSSAFVRVQSTFGKTIQDWGNTETLEVESQKFICFNREYVIPYIVGYDRSQKVCITVFGGDNLKVGKGYPLGSAELSLMEIAGRPSNVPILILGEATVGYLNITCNIRRRQQDFDLSSPDAVASLGFCTSAPTLSKLRAKKTSFVDSRTSYSLEFYCKELFRVHERLQLKLKSSPEKNPDEEKQANETISKFLSMVRVKKLQYSIRAYVTSDHVPEEMFFYDDIELDELDSWRMVYSTRRIDFFKPCIHDQSPEIAEDIIIGEGGWQADTCWTVAFVVLMHFTTSAGQEGVQPLVVKIENMTAYMKLLQEYLDEQKNEMTRKKHGVHSQNAAAKKPLKKPPEDVLIQFIDKSRSTSKYNELQSTMTFKSLGSVGDMSSPLRLGSNKSKPPKSQVGGILEAGASAFLDEGGDEDRGEVESVDEFTQVVHAFIAVIRKTMKSPLSFKMKPRQDVQVIVAGPKYEEKLHALFQECYEDWQEKISVHFQHAVRMFQGASDHAFDMLQLLAQGYILAPVVLIDMFHPCFQQTLRQHHAGKHNISFATSAAAISVAMNKLTISESSCHVLHALLTFYETLHPLFPQGGNIRVLAGGNIHLPNMQQHQQSQHQRSWFSPWSASVEEKSDKINVKDTANDNNGLSQLQYVRKKGLPFVEEWLLLQPHIQHRFQLRLKQQGQLRLQLKQWHREKHRKHKKHHHHHHHRHHQWSEDEDGDPASLSIQSIMCNMFGSSSDSFLSPSFSIDKSKQILGDSYVEHVLQLQQWQRVVSHRGEGTALSLTEDQYSDYANRVEYGEARDLIRGFMEAAEAYLPVTDSHLHQLQLQQQELQFPNAQQQHSDKSLTNSNSNITGNNFAMGSTASDGRSRRRRLALYAGTGYDIDITPQDIQDSGAKLVPCIGKNHDFTALRELLKGSHGDVSGTTSTSACSSASMPPVPTHSNAAAAASSVSPGVVKPVVWILGRSPPLRKKVQETKSCTTTAATADTSGMQKRLEKLCLEDFPLHRQDSCLIIVLAAEHRYDFPVLDSAGQPIEELRAIGHPFDEFHRILGQLLPQRQRDYLAEHPSVRPLSASSTTPYHDQHSYSHRLSIAESKTTHFNMQQQENIFVIHQYAFSEVLARALEYEMMTNPFLRHHRHRPSRPTSPVVPSTGNNGGSTSSHHRRKTISGGGTAHSSGTNDAMAQFQHKLPRLSSLKAILSLIFSEGPSHTIDVHVIDQILGTGEEILDQHVHRIELQESLERKLSENGSDAFSHRRSSLLRKMVVQPDKMAQRAVSKVRSRASSLAQDLQSRIGNLKNRFRRDHSGLFNETIVGENKQDIIRDFAHVNAIKERFDAAIVELVRKQYYQILSSALHRSMSGCNGRGSAIDSSENPMPPITPRSPVAAGASSGTDGTGMGNGGDLWLNPLAWFTPGWNQAASASAEVPPPPPVVLSETSDPMLLPTPPEQSSPPGSRPVYTNTRSPSMTATNTDNNSSINKTSKTKQRMSFHFISRLLSNHRPQPSSSQEEKEEKFQSLATSSSFVRPPPMTILRENSLGNGI